MSLSLKSLPQLKSLGEYAVSQQSRYKKFGANIFENERLEHKDISIRRCPFNMAKIKERNERHALRGNSSCAIIHISQCVEGQNYGYCKKNNRTS